MYPLSTHRTPGSILSGGELSGWLSVGELSGRFLYCWPAYEQDDMSQFVKDTLAEIDATTQETFDLATRDAAKRKEGSRRKAYEKGIREVRDIAGKDAALELAEWIQEEIRTDERFPKARSVRKQGARICRDHGHDISTGSWLGA